MSTTIPTTAQVAASLERTARIAAPFIAFLVTAVILLTELAYDLGYLLGSAVHARNDQLSALWRRLWAAEPEALPAPAMEPIQAPAAPPAPHPLLTVAQELEQLTSKQLRQVLGTTRRCSKRELIAMALAI